MHILSTMHHFACMHDARGRRKCISRDSQHAVGGGWRRPDVTAEENETKQKNKKKSSQDFHFWRRRSVFGLLIAGDCNHSAAQRPQRGRLSSAGGGRRKRMSRLELKAAICHTRALRHSEGDSFMGMNLWTFYNGGRKNEKPRPPSETQTAFIRLYSSNLLEMIKRFTGVASY